MLHDLGTQKLYMRWAHQKKGCALGTQKKAFNHGLANKMGI
jgi:hypothetical protein